MARLSSVVESSHSQRKALSLSPSQATFFHLLHINPPGHLTSDIVINYKVQRITTYCYNVYNIVPKYRVLSSVKY